MKLIKNVSIVSQACLFKENINQSSHRKEHIITDLYNRVEYIKEKCHYELLLIV